MVQPIYLDYNGTTPIDSDVFETMVPFMEHSFGNPSSSNFYGIIPKKAVEAARRQGAGLINCSPGEIIFTSGGTESNNHAIKGIACAMADKGRHIITSMIEHPAVIEVCRFLEKMGFYVTYLPVDKDGLVSLSSVTEAIRADTVLITIMHANNEVGTIQPITEISRLAHEKGIIMHTDAAQSTGKIPVNVEKLGADLLSVAGHKLYGPKGIGALYIRKNIRVEKFCHGAGQEMGMRAGTENVAGIAGLGKACEIASESLERYMTETKILRDMLYNELEHKIKGVKLNGHPDKRLPNTLSISFKGMEANRLLEKIGLDVAASAGAACHSDEVEISHVLEAMDIPMELAKGTLRFSVGRMTTSDDIRRAVEVIIDAVD